MRVAIWTTASLEPKYEAVSKEVFHLGKTLPRSWIISVSPHLVLKFSLAEKYLGFNPVFYPFLRVLFPVIEYFFDINLVYGDISPWVYHKTLSKRPIVHSIAQSSRHPQREFLSKCKKIIVQTTSTREQLSSLGIRQDDMELWYPGVDLEKFYPAKSELVPGRPVRILFATAPRTEEEMEGRGCYLLIETARLDENIRFQFLYRPWRSGYTSLARTRQSIEKSGVKNIELSSVVAPDMNEIYARNHFTVVPYTVENGGKECPNSALESLACGIPVLISSQCPFSDFIGIHRCGVVFDPTPGALIQAIEEGVRDYADLSRNSRQAAEQHLDRSKTAQQYERLMADVGQSNC